MQKLYLLVSLAFVLSTRLDFSSQDCNHYLSKFSRFFYFEGEMVILNSTMVQINLKYFDFYFNDSELFGLVQEDGKTPESTCLDLRMIKFSPNNYNDTEQIFDIKIIPLQNSQKNQRYYSFLISQEEFETRMIKTENTNYYVYKGYYGIQLLEAETDLLQKVYYFQFTTIVDKFHDNIVETSSRTLSYNEIYYNQVSKIYWCKDFSCDEVTTQPTDLHFNDEFVILQYNDNCFFFVETYTSDGLYKKANILKIDNQNRGVVKILLKADIAWNNFKITVNSKQYESFEKIIYEQVSSDSGVIECIKREQSEDCLTCGEQFNINGFAQLSCNFRNSAQILFIILIILLLVEFIFKLFHDFWIYF